LHFFLFFLALHNADFLFGQAVEFIDHLVNLPLQLFNTGLFLRVLQEVVVFGDGEYFVNYTDKRFLICGRYFFIGISERGF